MSRAADIRIRIRTGTRTRIIYELRVGAFQDSDGDGSGDFRGLISRLDYLQDLGVTALWLLPFYPSPLRDDGYDISDYSEPPPGQRDARGLQGLSRGGASPPAARDHRARAQPHFRSAPVVPARAARSRREPRARFLRVERQGGSLLGRADHLPRFRDVELDLGSGRQGLLLASLLRAPAGPQLRQPGSAPGDAAHGGPLAGAGRRRTPARCRALSLRARGNELREPARDPRVPAAPAPARRRAFRGPHAARRGQSVARGCERLFRQGRRVPHGIPLPADAAAVHVAPDGGPLPAHRHHRADAPDLRELRSGRCSCATTTS